MIVRNFFIVCIVCGAFAVLFAKLVNYQQHHDNMQRFDQPFRLR
ncbi:hypothetical protein [Jiella pacifica]|nr:hypothetical protein [Jiella pacifica]